MAEISFCGADKGGGEICERPAGWGTNHPGIGRCKMHFGATPSHEHAANKIKIRQLAEEAAERRGLPPGTIDPAQVLSEELNRSYGIVLAIEERTDYESATWPDWQRVWMEERRHAVGLAKLMIDTGIAERLARVQEVQVVQLAMAVRQVLDGLNLSLEQQAIARELVPQVLRAIPTTGTEVSTDDDVAGSAGHGVGGSGGDRHPVRDPDRLPVDVAQADLDLLRPDDGVVDH